MNAAIQLFFLLAISDGFVGQAHGTQNAGDPWSGDWVAQSGEHTSFVPLKGIGGGTTSYNFLLQRVTWNVRGSANKLTGKTTLNANQAAVYYKDVPQAVMSHVPSVQISVEVTRLGPNKTVAELTGPAILTHLVAGKVSYGAPSSDFTILTKTSLSGRKKDVARPKGNKQSKNVRFDGFLAKLGPITDGPVNGRWLLEAFVSTERPDEAENQKELQKSDQHMILTQQGQDLILSKLDAYPNVGPWSYKKTAPGTYRRQGKSVHGDDLATMEWFELHGKTLLHRSEPETSYSVYGRVK